MKARWTHPTNNKIGSIARPPKQEPAVEAETQQSGVSLWGSCAMFAVPRTMTFYMATYGTWETIGHFAFFMTLTKVPQQEHTLGAFPLKLFKDPNAIF
jgi:hypothetical protein